MSSSEEPVRLDPVLVFGKPIGTLNGQLGSRFRA